MLWQRVCTNVIRSFCAASVACYSAGLSLAELTAPYEPVPVVNQDGDVVQ